MGSFVRETRGFYEETYSNGGYSGSGKEKVLTDLILKHVGDGFILDVGCGDASLICRGVGIDLSKQALIRAKRLKNREVYLILANIMNLPLRDRSFYCVMCIETLEHLWDPSTCLVEIKRVLKDEGKAVVVVPNTTSLTKRLALLFGIGFLDRPEHIQHFTFKTLEKILRFTGFKILKVMGDEVYIHKYCIGRKIAKIFPKYSRHILAIVEKPRN